MISVIILTYNRCKQLFDCLNSVLSQTFEDYEVVVVDNGSTDESRERLRTLNHPNVRLIENNKKTTLAGARNIGVENARGDVIAYTDDDCIVPSDWLMRIHNDLQENDAVGGIVLSKNPLPFPRWWDEDLNWIIGISVPGHFDERAGSVCYPQTANMAVKKDIVVKETFQQDEERKRFTHQNVYLGKMDDSLLWRREDTEFWKRLRIQGYKTLFDTELFVYHEIPEDRLKLSYLIKRSFNDGYVFFCRENQEQYLGHAFYNIFQQPLGTIYNVVHNKKKFLSSLTNNFIWSIRQMGYLWAYLKFKHSLDNLYTFVHEFVRNLINYVWDITKIVMRTGPIFYYKLTKFNKPLPTKPDNILVVSMGFLGDMVVIRPALELLREKFPNAKIALMCYRNGYPLVKDFDKTSSECDKPILDDVFLMPPLTNTNSNQWNEFLYNYLKHFPCDVSIIYYYHNGNDYAFFSSLHPSYVITYDKEVGFARQMWYKLANEQLYKNLSINEIENSLNLLRPLGVYGLPPKYSLTVYPEDEQYIDTLLKDEGIADEKIIGVHIGAGEMNKIWEQEKWSKLLKNIESLFPEYRLVFVSGPVEELMANTIINEVGLRAINLCGDTNVAQLTALIKRCSLLITTDSGPKHIAFALRVPTVTLYGATPPKQWGALWDREKHIEIVGGSYTLTTEEKMGLPINHQMRLIKIEDVVEAVKTIISEQLSVNSYQ